MDLLTVFNFDVMISCIYFSRMSTSSTLVLTLNLTEMVHDCTAEETPRGTLGA